MKTFAAQDVAILEPGEKLTTEIFNEYGVVLALDAKGRVLAYRLPDRFQLKGGT